MTDRERSCLRLTSEGMMAKQIARELDVTARTVNLHLSEAAAKLGTRGRTQTVAMALKLGAI